MKNEYIKISVIIPVYNSEKYIQKCIESAINQTYNNIEIILVDDGSTDASGEICDSYEKDNCDIKVIHKENGGQTSARISGINYAEGEYVTFLDSDDYIDNNTFEKILSLVDTKLMPEMIIYDLVEEYIDHNVVKKNNFKEGFYDRDRIEKEILPQALSYGKFFEFGILPNLVCKMIRKDYIDKQIINVSDSVRFGEDADMVFQWIPFLESIQIISYAPYHYNKRDDSMMEKSVKIKEIMTLQKDLYKSFLQSPFKACLLKQLEYYIKFIILLKNPREILGDKLCGDNKKIALYGAGGFGQSIYNYYNDSIVMWVDQNYKYYLEKGFSVSSIEVLIEEQEQYDVVYIAITSTSLCMKIKEKLKKYGLKKKIVFYENVD